MHSVPHHLSAATAQVSISLLLTMESAQDDFMAWQQLNLQSVSG